jgi:hypothetical protein
VSLTVVALAFEGPRFVTVPVAFPLGTVDWLRAGGGDGFRAFLDRALAAFRMNGK